MSGTCLAHRPDLLNKLPNTTQEMRRPKIKFALNLQLPPRGLEAPANSLGNTANPAPGGAKSGALIPKKPATDPALAALIDAWPTLPEAIRAGILAMVRAAGG